nr:unnamed protein product [Digitaria exilis]
MACAATRMNVDYHLRGGGIGSEEAAGDHLALAQVPPAFSTSLHSSWNWGGSERDKQRTEDGDVMGFIPSVSVVAKMAGERGPGIGVKGTCYVHPWIAHAASKRAVEKRSMALPHPTHLTLDAKDGTNT